MTRKELEQLRDLIQEVDTLNQRYLNIPKSEDVGITYGDYKTGKKIVKVAHGKSGERANNLKEKIEAKVVIISRMILEMEEYLDSITQSEIRDIFRMHYVKGMSHADIAKQKGYSREAITKKIERFWEKQ